MGKPLKRNANLVWLSRDHHDGLLIGWKVHRGFALGRPLAVMSEFITQQFAHHLEPHFIEEEQWLFAKLDVHDDLRKEAEAQHSSLRQIVAGLSSNTSEALVNKFIDALDAHIRFEERELFPHIEQQLGEEALASIGEELSKTHQHKKPDGWSNTFWLKDS